MSSSPTEKEGPSKFGGRSRKGPELKNSWARKVTGDLEAARATIEEQKQTIEDLKAVRAIVDEPWQAKEDLKHARALIEQQRATIDDLLSSIQWLELRRNDAAWAKVREVIEAIANARPASREGQGGV